MGNKIPCAVVKDILPLYIDELVSDETKQTIGEHLDECAECKELYDEMKPEKEEVAEENIKEVDYLKKVRGTNKKIIAISAVLVVLLAVMAVAVVIMRKKISAVENRKLDISEFVYYDVEVDKNELEFKGSTIYEVKYDFSSEDGVVTVNIYGEKQNLSGEHVELSFTNDCEIKEVRINDYIVWQDGMIDKNAAALYHAYNPYVGNISADNTLAGLVRIRDLVGNFTTELKTAEEPYGWIIKTEKTIYNIQEEQFKEELKKESMQLIALIGNLSYMSYEYSTEDGPQTFTFTKEEATELIGKDIKEFGKTAKGTQQLYDFCTCGKHFD
ncbi:MAG: DUF4825 domain-containing protein [Lachnospiraceae bacterium]|nr:DUF4825 domain-containing protein [Lachnospiraceae bacterium]